MKNFKIPDSLPVSTTYRVEDNDYEVFLISDLFLLLPCKKMMHLNFDRHANHSIPQFISTIRSKG
jgi:hypothetical protein